LRPKWGAGTIVNVQGLDKNKDGRICAEEILAILKDKLPEDEVRLCRQARSDTKMSAGLCCNTTALYQTRDCVA